jgi:pyroglutamyl-peptidase
VRIETQAENRSRALAPDAEGRTPLARPVPGGPSILRCAAPAGILAQRFRCRGIRATISRDAGAYLCNLLFYKSLYVDLGRKRPTVFIHLPKPFQPQRRAARLPRPRSDQLLRALEDIAIDLIRVSLTAR